MEVKTTKSDQEIYNFNSSGIGDSWLIGTDNLRQDANAFKNGISDCPENLTVPSSLTYNGETKPVEVIGESAFNNCAWRWANGQTKRLTLTKQVKVIKYSGLGGMLDLEVFVIEDGSVLETIEQYGLSNIGYNFGKTEGNRVTLTLPSTLSSVFKDGIYFCHLFNVIIYCGSHSLSNYTQLEEYVSSTKVMVSSQYPPGQKIFNRDPDRSSPDEVAEKCSKMDPPPNFTYVYVDGGCEVTGWGNSTSMECPPHLEIPEEINGSAVVAIKESAFENCETEGPISLPSKLKRVGASAFANTSFVTSVVAASNELEVGEAAFQNCGRSVQQPINVSLPEKTQLSKSAFAGAKICEVYVM